ncbi:trp operon leader peptide [Streptomyces sp. HNM0574]|nr:trp operon leader peptide [Streptomyces sp. HNM0574]
MFAPASGLAFTVTGQQYVFRRCGQRAARPLRRPVHIRRRSVVPGPLPRVRVPLMFAQTRISNWWWTAHPAAT